MVSHGGKGSGVTWGKRGKYSKESMITMKPVLPWEYNYVTIRSHYPIMSPHSSVCTVHGAPITPLLCSCLYVVVNLGLAKRGIKLQGTS